MLGSNLAIEPLKDQSFGNISCSIEDYFLEYKKNNYHIHVFLFYLFILSLWFGKCNQIYSDIIHFPTFHGSYFSRVT